jgi:hypothetical protein
MDVQCLQDICYAVRKIENSCEHGDSVHYDKKNNVLCIKGEIDVFGNMYNKIKSLKIKRNVKVVLESNGGGVDSSIDIVDYLTKYNYTAMVYKDCISSCAQFLFIGSNNRIIVGNGRVIFHGGPFTDEDIKRMKLDKNSENGMKLENDRFRKFFENRNISLDALYKKPDSQKSIVDFSGTEMKIMSKYEFEKYGIRVNYFM